MIDIVVDSLSDYSLKSDIILFIGHRVENPYNIDYSMWKCYYGDIENDIFIGIVNNKKEKLEKERLNFETSYILCFDIDIEQKCNDIEGFYKKYIKPSRATFFNSNNRYSILDLILKSDFASIKKYNVKCIVMLSNSESWLRVIEL